MVNLGIECLSKARTEVTKMDKSVQHYRPFAGGYVSEAEQFLQEFLRQHPEVDEDRRRGWNIWWDHRVDLDELQKQRADSVPVKPYHYE